MPPPGDRYDLRKDGYDSYEIFDTKTGRTVFVDGKLYSKLKLDEADVYLDMLNSGDYWPDEVTLQ